MRAREELKAFMSEMRRRVATWGAIALAWSFFALVLTAQGHLAMSYFGRPAPLSVHLRVHFTCAMIWLAFTPIILWLTRRFPFRSPSVARSMAVHLFASVVLSVGSLAIFAVSDRAIRGLPWHLDAFVQMVEWLAIRELHVDLLKYWAVVGIVQALEYYSESRERRLAASRLETRLSEMRLQALRSQLQPHFLFNALNSIAVLMYKDVRLANAMLVELSELLRASLDSASAHEVTLRRELEFVERYLSIERVRFSDRLEFSLDVDESLREARVPNLLLQPLVENSIRHGISKKERGGRIELSARRERGTLRLTVRDDGPGISVAPRVGGVGLANTAARLEQLYGAAHTFVVSNAPEGGATVEIVIPLRFSSGEVSAA